MGRRMSEARDWDEYLAWTRGASPGEYRLTEELAWRRLEDARLARRVEAFALVAAEPETTDPGPSAANPIEPEPDWSF